MIAADLNGYGKLDLITIQYYPTNSVTILLGNGDGTFQSPITVQQGGVDSALDSAVGDFNNDGKLDLVLAPSEYLIQEVPHANPSPSSLNFPALLTGAKSAAQVVTFTNMGSASLILKSIGLTGADASDFSQTNTCGSTLAIHASCSISVTFSPEAGGARSATLTFSTNQIGNPLTVALTGTGQDFSLTSSSSTTATVSPGQTASYGLTVNPNGGFNQTVALSCGGTPAQSTCLVLPSSLKLSGSLTAVVTVATANTAGLTQPLSLPPLQRNFGGWSALASAFVLAMLAGLVGLRRIPWGRLVPSAFALVLLLSIGITMLGCGGGTGNSGNNGTPAGSYILTVTGTFTSGSTTVTRAISSR